ncbi:MAG: zinc-finger domain-containing protein [Cucumibacter sp.]
MAEGATPHFHNTGGLPRIEIGTREFQCIGALPPHDHPHVFLDMGDENEIVCPYCSTHYLFDPGLPDRGSRPAGARYELPST